MTAPSTYRQNSVNPDGSRFSPGPLYAGKVFTMNLGARLRMLLPMLAMLALGFSIGRFSSAVNARAAMPMGGMHASEPSTIDRELKAAMNRMMDEGSQARLTGDADHDFIALMIPHHEAAVRMARVELQRGRRSDVRSLAMGIVRAQQREIAQMRAWLRKW